MASGQLGRRRPTLTVPGNALLASDQFLAKKKNMDILASFVNKWIFLKEKFTFLERLLFGLKKVCPRDVKRTRPVLKIDLRSEFH